MDDAPPPVAAKYVRAASVVRFVGWAEIAVALAAVVVTLPGSLVLLLFGGIIIVAPPIALGIVGLGLAKGLRLGHRAVAASVWAFVQASAYVALALHSRTWDARTIGGENFFLLCQIVFWIAATLNLSIPIILATRSRSAPTPSDDVLLELKPSMRPWLVGAGLVLASIVLGIAVAAEA